MGASLAPEGVVVEEGSQRVMPWGFLVYRLRAGVIIIIVIIMAYQHIPTSHIPTWWEYVIMMKGGNMTQSNSHHTHV